jgi:hypothetical protein
MRCAGQVGFNNFYLPYEFNQKHLYCYEVQ